MSKPQFLDSQGQPLKPGDLVYYKFAGVVIRTTVKHLRRDGQVHIAQGYGGANVYAASEHLTKIVEKQLYHVEWEAVFSMRADVEAESKEHAIRLVKNRFEANEPVEASVISHENDLPNSYIVMAD
jgi:hypothetical protein